MRVKEESEKAGLKLNVQKTKIRASGPIASWQIEGEKRRSKDRFYFLGLQNHCGRWLPAMKLNILTPWKKSYNKPRQHIKKQRHHLPIKVHIVKAMVFPVQVWMWEFDLKEGEVPKNWHFQIVVLEKTLESLLDSKKIKSVNPKGNQPCIFIGRSNAEAEAPIPWPLDAKSWLIGKDPEAGKVWKQQDKRVTEDETVGLHHQFNGHELGQTPGDGEKQRSLTCYSPWGCKEFDTTWQLNSSNNLHIC